MDTAPGGARTLFAGGGRIYSFNAVATTPATVINPNPGRTRATFHNPGVNDIFVAPLLIQNGGSDAPLVPSLTALGGCLRIYANGGVLVVDGSSAQQGWQAFAAAGNNNPLTVLDSVV